MARAVRDRRGEMRRRRSFVEHVQADYLPHAVLIDCSASQAVADRYADWLRRGIHVITPNKRAHSGPMPYYEDLKRLSRTSRTHFLYEATVGAGLPVIQTLERSRRDGRRDPQHQRHFLRHARLPVQPVRREPAVLGDRPRGEGARIHRARSARRPVGHGRSAQSRDPRARGGSAPRACGHRDRESRAGRARQGLGRGVPGSPRRFRCADGRASEASAARRPGATLRRGRRRARRAARRCCCKAFRHAIRSRTSA